MTKGTMKDFLPIQEKNPNIKECKVFLDEEKGQLFFVLPDEEENSDSIRTFI